MISSTNSARTSYSIPHSRQYQRSSYPQDAAAFHSHQNGNPYLKESEGSRSEQPYKSSIKSTADAILASSANMSLTTSCPPPPPPPTTTTTTPPASNLRYSNPVGLLQERYRHLNISYDMGQSFGPSHCPTFIVNVSAGDFRASGHGNSKKEAKHKAAATMMDKLEGISTDTNDTTDSTIPANNTIHAFNDIVSSTNSNNSNNNDNNNNSRSLSPVSLNDVINPIGLLQELCMKNKISIPTYELLSQEMGETSRFTLANVFVIKCTVKTLSTVGEASSKREAKRDASKKMIKKLNEQGLQSLQQQIVSPPQYEISSQTQQQQNTPLLSPSQQVSVPPKQISSPKQESIPPQQMSALPQHQQKEISTTLPEERQKEDEIQSSRNGKLEIQRLTPSQAPQIESFYKKILTNNKTKLQELDQMTFLQRGSSNVNYVQFLDDLAAENQFPVTYEVLQQTSEPEVECLVQLGTFPVAVCLGTAMSKGEAKVQAARAALNYLKLILLSSDNNTNQVK